MLTEGTRIRVIKGCNARSVSKNDTATVTHIENLGADYGHFVKVTLRFHTCTQSWYVRHQNRLSDIQVSLNDGNPLHKLVIEVR